MITKKNDYNSIQLVIFDMDGLMFDTERLGVEGWKYAFESFNLPIPMSILVKKIGLNSIDSRKLFEEELGSKFDYEKVKEVKREYVIKYISEYGTPKKKGLIELLDYLEKNKIKKAVATSRSKKMANFYLDKSGIKESFDKIITGDMVVKGKPNPDIFLYTSQELMVDPKNSIVLEDSINGIKAANNAKMLSIMIPDLVTDVEEVSTHYYAKCNDLLEVIKVLQNYNS